MSQTPEEIRADIERTRQELGTDVDALADKVNPANIAHRQTEKVKTSFSNVKDTVMGKAEDVADSVKGKAHNVKGTVQNKAGDVKGSARDTAGQSKGSAQSAAGQARAKAHNASQAVHNAPRELGSKTSGNPLAAGLIAFGAGLLVASLIPASQKEREAASALKEQAAPLKAEVTDAAKQVVEDFKEPAQEAVASVKESATNSAQNVKDEGQQAAGDVKNRAQDAKSQVKSQ